MITKAFLFRKYAQTNADLAEAFGGDDEMMLADHFDRFGQREMRGLQFNDYMRLEGLLCSDAGDFYIAGWADRRIISTLDVVIEVGYVRHDLGRIEPVWYPRTDVTTLTGDTQNDQGFLALIHLPDMLVHSDLTIYINGKRVRHEATVRWQSTPLFLNQALGAAAVVADMPIGKSIQLAEPIYNGFVGVWQRFLEGLCFTLAFENRPRETHPRSIVITLYRGADMLLVQLRELAGFLIDTDTEVLVVGNDLIGAEATLVQLRAFCQIHDISLRVYLCSGNSGFSRGNNFGAEMARGETLILMNPDIFPPETDAARAYAFLTEPAGDALHGALMYYGDGMLMHSGMYAARDLCYDQNSGFSAPVLRCEHFGKGLSHRITDDDASLAHALEGVQDDKLLVSAALWKIRRDVFFDLGGLSTEYLFAYYEDADFCLRLREMGIEIKLDRSARWIHMEGVGRTMTPAQRTFMWLNRYFFTQRFRASAFVVDAADEMDML